MIYNKERDERWLSFEVGNVYVWINYLIWPADQAHNGHTKDIFFKPSQNESIEVVTLNELLSALIEGIAYTLYF